MQHHERVKAALLLITCGVTSIASCSDTNSIFAPVPQVQAVHPLSNTVPALTSQLNCTVDVATLQVNCVESTYQTVPYRAQTASQAKAAVPGGPSRTILGTNQVKLTSSNVVNDTTAQDFSFDVTLKDLLSTAIGTPDGTEVVGSKVFFVSGPTATTYRAPGDTGTMYVKNADGVGNFSSPNQAYYAYAGALQPQQVSALRHWIFHRPRSVTNFAFGVQVFTATPLYLWVPESAPASVPAWVFADTNIVSDAAVLSGSVAKNAVLVSFDSGTTAAARQAAVAKVSGVVVGGVPLDSTEGLYVVQPASGATVSQLLAASDSIGTMPGVALSIPALTDSASLDYRQPIDGVDAKQWRLNPDSADGNNWALERIAAPFAWGCSTGSSSTRVAVVDIGFHDVFDLHPNVGGATHYETSSPERHGTAVASILAAVGDNQLEITGVMWKADLRLFDRVPITHADTLLVNTRKGGITLDMRILAAAVSSGARVINFSGHLGTPTADSAGATFAEIVRKAFRLVVRLRNGQARAPLFVVAAGNLGIDARYNGFPQVEAEFPSRVLVVGAAPRVGSGLSSFSNTGARVKITAPGEDLLSLDHQGHTNVTFVGTSGAAPYVAGVAGLLFSFNPALTVSEVRDYIIDGAVNGGRTAGGIPLLNAYESLKLAARKPGGPVCGQRVWSDSGAVYVERYIGATPERLFFTPGAPSLLDAMHGGKDILFKTPGSFHQYGFVNGIWGTSPFDAGAMPSGASSSALGYSHNGNESISLAQDTVSSSVEEAQVTVSDSNQVAHSATVQFALGPVGPAVNGDSGYHTVRIESIVAAFPQQGDTAIIAVNRVRATTVDSIFTCIDDRGVPGPCHRVLYVWRPDTAYLYKMNVHASTPSLVPLRKAADTTLFSIGLAETNSESFATFGARVDTTGTTVGGAISWCVTLYRDNRLTGSARLSVPGTYACDERGTSGMSPNKGPNGRLPLSAFRASSVGGAWKPQREQVWRAVRQPIARASQVSKRSMNR